MIISEKTKISKLIEHNIETIEVISTINRHFKKLRNPILRKALAPRVSIADAARIGGVAVCIMIDKLKAIGFETDDGCACDTISSKKELTKNLINISMRKENIVELDVRPILAGGVDPFEAIMAKLNEMDDSQTLLIINTFEPIPLLSLLKKKGYAYETERPEDGLVHTYLEKSSGGAEEQAADTKTLELDFGQTEGEFAGKMTEVDVRDMEMPMPMVTILEEIEKLPNGHALYVHHKKLPQYLIPELEDRGYSWVSKEVDDANVKLIIFK
ncbi:MAG: DUF2249 domain-containing protein [Chlorobi bacterium]|nr:DUF2249 domain-containing protein [Chlorobiota bacterium]